MRGSSTGGPVYEEQRYDGGNKCLLREEKTSLEKKIRLSKATVIMTDAH
jgi:hypothetical protein